MITFTIIGHKLPIIIFKYCFSLLANSSHPVDSTPYIHIHQYTVKKPPKKSLEALK